MVGLEIRSPSSIAGSYYTASIRRDQQSFDPFLAEAILIEPTDGCGTIDTSRNYTSKIVR